jgi:hypothetical protein
MGNASDEFLIALKRVIKLPEITVRGNALFFFIMGLGLLGTDGQDYGEWGPFLDREGKRLLEQIILQLPEDIGQLLRETEAPSVKPVAG